LYNLIISFFLHYSNKTQVKPQLCATEFAGAPADQIYIVNNPHKTLPFATGMGSSTCHLLMSNPKTLDLLGFLNSVRGRQQQLPTIYRETPHLFRLKRERDSMFD
jgi:hypothetical protein